MQKNIVTRLAACLVLALTLAANAQDKKADPTGTWKWSISGQNGQSREVTAKLKAEGDKVTGTVSGRNNDTAITEGTLKGDEIAFTVSREYNGNKMTQKYTGKVSADTIKGKVESKRGDAEAQSRDWEAKREAATPKAEEKPAAK
jgi:hypothetical protein